MPKVNVYLNDELAEAVRRAGIPISSVCQRALEDALRSATALREGAGRQGPDLPADVRLPGLATDRLVRAIHLAFAQAEGQRHAEVGTGHLVLGMLDEGGNLGLRVLGGLEIEEPDLRTELTAALSEYPRAKAEPRPNDHARHAIKAMGDEALRLGHNYIGCEHLLLAIVSEPDGEGGRVLRSMGVDLTVARRAVGTALIGFIHARANPAPDAPPMERLLAGIAERLDRIEASIRTPT